MIRCPFCGGPYVKKDDRVACLMCNRSTDIEYELCVQKEQKKKHHNYHTYSGSPFGIRKAVGGYENSNQ